MKKILIIDDHPLVRKGLTITIESEVSYKVCCQASSAKEGLKHIENDEIDLVVLDISLPDMSGLEVIKLVKIIKPDLKILVVSRHDEELYAERAIRSGAKGYIMKLEAGDVILKAVHTVLNGGVYISDRINKKLLIRMISGYKSLSQSPLEVLSDRELEVFELTGCGLSSREIADQLHLSNKTVETYRARIKDKLSLNSATELVLHAAQWVEGVNQKEDRGKLTTDTKNHKL